jgi:hypothetical protein
MLENNIYNIDREFDYATIKAIVLKSVEKIAKEEKSKRTGDVIADSDRIGNNNVKLSSPPTPLLKLKIRNTTKHLNWRIAVIKRDNLTCRICHTSIRDHKKPTIGGASS